jgi:hypothetical protein
MPVPYPHKVTVTLSVELEVRDSEAESYIFADPASGSTDLQVGLIADLFDVLGYHTDLSVLRINGTTFADVQKKLSASL